MTEQGFGRVVVSQPGQPDQEFDLFKASIQIGRGMTNDIILNDTRVSRSHARLDFGPQGVRVLDLGSSNGTLLNGKPVKDAILPPGAELKLGGASLTYHPQEAPSQAGMTVIDTLSDLEATMISNKVPVALNETSGPRLVIYTPGKTWEVALGAVESLSIGRTDDNDIILDMPKVSRNHARLERSGDVFILRDQNSTNGVWLGEQKVSEQPLADGQALRIGQARLVFKKGFHEEALTIADGLPARLEQRLPVVFVPGMMGSKLYQGSECVWPNLKVLFAEPQIYAYPGKKVLEPRGILDQVVIVPNLVKMDQYNRLGDYLVEDLGYTRGQNFYEFAYDWRQDVRISARQLAQAVQNWNITGQFILIAHSLGTLVSRYFVECLGGKQKVRRMILMGGPHVGTPAGLASLTIGPNLLPFGLMGEKLRQVVATFPSAYQIIPEYACGVNQNGERVNFLQNEAWLQPWQMPLLRAAREFRQELVQAARHTPSIPTVSIFGYGLKTVDRLDIRMGPDGLMQNMAYVLDANGDDSVPQQSAFLTGSEIHPVQQHHGALFVDNDVKMRLKLELGISKQ